MKYLLHTIDNGDNDGEQNVVLLKATDLYQAVEEAKSCLLDFRFGEDREDEGPDDNPKSIFPKSSSCFLEHAHLLEVAGEAEIDIVKVFDEWAREWKKRNK